jgi:hypothetical protein
MANLGKQASASRQAVLSSISHVERVKGFVTDMFEDTMLTGTSLQEPLRIDKVVKETDPFPPPQSFADDFLTTVSDPANIPWDDISDSDDDSDARGSVMRFNLPRKWATQVGVWASLAMDKSETPYTHSTVQTNPTPSSRRSIDKSPLLYPTLDYLKQLGFNSREEYQEAHHNEEYNIESGPTLRSLPYGPAPLSFTDHEFDKPDATETELVAKIKRLASERPKRWKA